MVLVDRYKTVVFRLALALLGHRENAEDATQDTFVLAFSKLKTLKDPSSFPSGCANWQFAFAFVIAAVIS